MNNGAFQTSREIFENPIWQNIVEFRLFFLIYGKAIFTEEGCKQGNVFIGKGQWLRSYRNLQSDLEYIENRSIKRYSLSRIKRAIDNLVKDKRITVEETELGTLFTVVNYTKYQCLDNYKKHNENAERTQREQNENAERTQREQNENAERTQREQNENAERTEMEQQRNNNKKDKNDTNIYSAFFEEMWSLYPSKKGKGRISNTKKKEIYKLGDEFKRCISRYIEDVEARRRNGFPELKYQNGSTFFNSGYEDYLDKNYQEKEPPPVRVLKPIYKKARGVDDD